MASCLATRGTAASMPALVAPLRLTVSTLRQLRSSSQEGSLALATESRVLASVYLQRIRTNNDAVRRVVYVMA